MTSQQWGKVIQEHRRLLNLQIQFTDDSGEKQRVSFGLGEPWAGVIPTIEELQEWEEGLDVLGEEVDPDEEIPPVELDDDGEEIIIPVDEDDEGTISPEPEITPSSES